jgi:hypothetical protein
MSPRTPNDLLSLLQQAALDDLQQTSDEELLKEALEDGDDAEALLAALQQRVREQADAAAQQNCTDHLKRSVISLERSLKKRACQGFSPPADGMHAAGVHSVVRKRAQWWGGKGRRQATLDSALEEEEQALAASILMKLNDSSKARCRSDLPFDCDAESLVRRDRRSELIKRLLLELVEYWIFLRMDEFSELADLLPESRARILRPLLRNAIHDPQILKFASISLGTLASMLCTSALAKASGLDIDPHRSADERDELLRRIRAKAEWRAFHNLIDHEPRLVTDSVDPARAISALATMQRALAAYNPDAIVAVAGGGEIVGDFLRKQIGMDARRYFVASCKDGEYTLDRDLRTCGVIKRVVIIDDISRTGRTLTSIRNHTFGGMDAIEFKALALVSAAVAIDRIRDFFLLLPVVSQSSNVSVPWDTKGSYRTTRTSYVFGADHGARLKVPKELYEQIYGDVGT